MKTKKELQSSMAELTSVEISRLRFIIRELEGLVENKEINEENYRSASNILNEVRSIKDLYSDRLLSLYKSGAMIT